MRHHCKPSIFLEKVSNTVTPTITLASFCTFVISYQTFNALLNTADIKGHHIIMQAIYTGKSGTLKAIYFSGLMLEDKKDCTCNMCK